MKINKKYLLAILFPLLGSYSYAQNNTTNTFKTTVDIKGYCSMSVNNINFGTLSMPLMAQSSLSAINLLCSRDIPYTIDMAYGGVYGQGSTADGSYWTFHSTRASDGSSNWFAKYSSTGALIQYAAAATPNAERYISPAVAASLGCTYSGPSQCATGSAAYTYGRMNGAAKSDKVAYYIAVPGDNSKVWNNGVNNYKSVGTGTAVTINFTGYIVPGQSTSSYPAADMYMDTVTATITY